MRIFLIILLIATSGAAYGQTAEDYRQRQQDLAELSSVFGELHHIRRMCEPRREADIWRNRMKKIVDLEQPPTEARQAMVQRFNAGYRNAGGHYRACTRRARDHAAARAQYARAIVARLAAPLLDADPIIKAPMVIEITAGDEDGTD